MILTEGARVRLRMMRREDADELYALLSDEAVMRWLEPPFNRAQAERFLEQAGLSEPPLIYAAENMAGEFLGYAIYHDYDEYSRELGWVLKPAFWHKGYADEMTDLLTALARREGKNAVIECVPEQTASAHIARGTAFRMRAARTAVTFTACAVKNKKEGASQAGKRPLCAAVLLCADG